MVGEIMSAKANWWKNKHVVNNSNDTGKCRSGALAIGRDRRWVWEVEAQGLGFREPCMAFQGACTFSSRWWPAIEGSEQMNTMVTFAFYYYGWIWWLGDQKVRQGLMVLSPGQWGWRGGERVREVIRGRHLQNLLIDRVGGMRDDNGPNMLLDYSACGMR